jgi:hypothetical protein
MKDICSDKAEQLINNVCTKILAEYKPKTKQEYYAMTYLIQTQISYQLMMTMAANLSKREFNRGKT